MNAAEKAKALEAEEAAREPGMGAALLAVLTIIVSVLILSVLIYLVMVLIVPAERQPRKATEVEQPLLHAQGSKRIAN